MAIFIALLKLNGAIIRFNKAVNGFSSIEKIITVETLKNRLKWASFLESFSAFIIP